jgi:hypothetical protein
LKVLASAALIAVLVNLAPSPVAARCHPIEVTKFTPTGIAGCEVYGEGLASWWAGPGVARNDCLWPWENCQPIVIRSLITGRSITVRPTMFGDLYTGTSNQRLVDLDPAALRALGLWEMRSHGLFPVRVTPISDPAHTALPDTASR